MAKKSNTKVEVIKNENGDILFTPAAAYMSGIQAAVTFRKDVFYEDKETKPRAITIGKKDINYIPWGSDNLYPQNVVLDVEKSPVASPLIEFKVDLMFGSGFKLGHMVEGQLVEYTEDEINANSKLKEFADFISDNNLDLEYEESCSDTVWFSQSEVEIILNKDLDKIVELSTKEKVFSRWSEMNDDGKIENHLYSAKWGESVNEENCTITPALDFRKPGLDLKRKLGLKPDSTGETKNTAGPRYIYPIRFAAPARKYYPKPYWHSIITSGWLEYANAIPAFKKAMMTNSMNVKYHIEISDKYFPRLFASEGLTKKSECDARRIKEFEDIQNNLIGQEKVGKPIISYYSITPDGRVEIHDIKITPIENKIGGEYIEDSREASAMTYTAFNVHPNLVGVIPSKNSSNLSGSDKRELLRIAQTFQVRKRNPWLNLLKLVKEINGYPQEAIVYVSDVILTTLDQGKEVQSIDTQA